MHNLLAPMGAVIITDKIYSYGPSALKCFALRDKERGKQAKNIAHIMSHWAPSYKDFH